MQKINVVDLLDVVFVKMCVGGLCVEYLDLLQATQTHTNNQN